MQAQVRVAAFRAGQLQRLLGRFGHDVASRREIVGRNLLTPPQLARDAPVAHVLHPVPVDVLELRGNQTHRVVHNGLQCGFGQLVHLQEPLHRQLRLDGDAGPLGVAHVVRIGLDLLEQAGRGQIALDLLAHGETVHARVAAAVLVQRAVVVEDVDRLKVVLLAQHVVVHVVGRGYLQRAGSELDVDVAVADDRNRAADQRHDDAGVLRQVFVPLIVGVDA